MGQREAARAAASVAKARAELEARTERETQVIASLHSQVPFVLPVSREWLECVVDSLPVALLCASDPA